MAAKLTIQYQGKPGYDILYRNSFDELGKELRGLGMEGRNACIITDSNVEKLYANEIETILATVCGRVARFTFPAGEQSKNLDVVRDAYTFLIQQGFGRRDFIAALGGGVVGDLAGFTAATYQRGMDFIQIPTTLLSQVDSSIGGKTGVDFDSYKNMVGAFHMPKLVYTNLSVLKDLEERQFFSGIAEVMKSALIRDSVFYEWIIKNMYEICGRDLPEMEQMVMKSNQIKQAIVEKDPTEQGERALLNFGHTVGHAIEKAKNFELLHGECVALGCVAASYISMKRNLLSSDEYYEIRDMFVPFCLPISVDHIVPEEVAKLTRSDKKVENGKIRFILLKGIGKAVIETSVSEEEILEAVKEIYYSEEDDYE